MIKFGISSLLFNAIGMFFISYDFLSIKKLGLFVLFQFVSFISIFIAVSLILNQKTK